MIVSMLFRLLQEVEEDLGRIPSVLHLSLDNCGRENKNRFYLSTLDYKMIVTISDFFSVS